MSRQPIAVVYSPPERTILVTGGAGFVGSAVCRLLVRDGANRVVCLDRAPAGGGLAPIAGAPNFRFVEGDIGDRGLLAELFAEEHIDSVMHLASDSAIDRPHSGTPSFIETNVAGTFHLLEAALDHWRTLMPDARARFRLHHVATDVVIGDRPCSPFAASKVASEQLVRAWHDSFGLPVLLSASSSNYGPNQAPNKFVPATIRSALAGLPVSVPGNGADMRDWLHVDDHASALRTVLYRGQVGETYPISARDVHSSVAVAALICDLIDRIEPRPDGRKRRSLINFVNDRAAPAHRDAIDPSKSERLLGWRPLIAFRDGVMAEIDSSRAAGGQLTSHGAALAG